MFGRFALAGVLLGCGSPSSSPPPGSGSAIEAPRDARVIDAHTIDATAPPASEDPREPEPEEPSDPAADDMACSPDDPRCTGPLENAHKSAEPPRKPAGKSRKAR